MCLAPEQFDTELEKVLWVLTFFKLGHVLRWLENLFQDKAVMESFSIQSWAVFKQQFRALFLPSNAKADVINTLEESSYFQGLCTVDNYLDHFHSLVSDTGYTNPHTLVVKFCQGLRAAIQSQIATMPTGRPGDADPQTWFEAAR